MTWASGWAPRPVMVGAPLPIMVGATPANGMPALGAGVDAMVDIGSSSKLRASMGPVGSVVLWAGLRSIGQFAKGDSKLAAGAAAATVIAGMAYYAATMLAQQTTQVATAAAKEVIGSLSDIPLLGTFIAVGSAIVEYGGSATGKSQSDVTNNCRAQFSTVRWGTKADGELMPADVFMAASSNAAEAVNGPEVLFIRANDGLSPFAGTIRGKNLADLTYLLIELEKAPASNKDAETAWPGAGLTAEERSVLRKLRLGMSAAYKRPAWVSPPSGEGLVKERTDGGASLWPLYADILWTAWRQGRLPYGYLLWRAAEQDKYYAMWAAADAKGTPKNNAGQSAVNSHFNQSDAGNTIPCALLDNRSILQLTQMLKGWDQKVVSPYVSFAGEQAADNPFHVPPENAFTRSSGGGVASWLLLAGIGAAGFYLVAPAAALSTYHAAQALASRGASKAVSSGRHLLAQVRK